MTLIFNCDQNYGAPQAADDGRARFDRLSLWAKFMSVIDDAMQSMRFNRVRTLASV